MSASISIYPFIYQFPPLSISAYLSIYLNLSCFIFQHPSVPIHLSIIFSPSIYQCLLLYLSTFVMFYFPATNFVHPAQEHNKGTRRLQSPNDPQFNPLGLPLSQSLGRLVSHSIKHKSNYISNSIKTPTRFLINSSTMFSF